MRRVLLNPADLRNPHYPLLVNNSWGSGMAINARQADQMIADSAALGLEMFHLDAGWFRGVGDWYPIRSSSLTVWRPSPRMPTAMD